MRRIKLTATCVVCLLEVFLLIMFISGAITGLNRFSAQANQQFFIGKLASDLMIAIAFISISLMFIWTINKNKKRLLLVVEFLIILLIPMVIGLIFVKYYEISIYVNYTCLVVQLTCCAFLTAVSIKNCKNSTAKT